MKRERQSNIELLKVFSMIGVIILHYNNATIGNAFGHVQMHSMKAYALYYLESMAISAVNVFMLISGYFMARSERIDFKKPVRLLIQVVVFREMMYLLQVAMGRTTLSLGAMVTLLLPASYFAVLYAAVYVLSPFVNRLMLSLHKKSLRALMAIAVLLISIWPYGVDMLEKIGKMSFAGLSTVGMYGSQSGYTLVNFLLMYMIGAYLRICDVKAHPAACAGVLVLSWTALFAFAIWLVDTGVGAGLAWEYCNPLVILSAVSAFLLFAGIPMKSCTAINSLSKATFSVYLMNSVLLLLFADTRTYVSGSGIGMLLHIACVCAGICLVSWAAQWAYDRITAPVYRLIDSRLKIDTTFSLNACRDGK